MSRRDRPRRGYPPVGDLTLIGYSRMAHVAAEVAASLAESDGLDIEVVDLRSLRPLDRATIIESVKQDPRRRCP